MTPMRMRLPQAPAVLTVLIAAVCIAYPLIELTHYAPYQFALTLEPTWQGAIEIAGLCALLLAAQKIRRPAIRFFAMLIPAELFLRRHGVDLAALIDLLYLETIIGIGSVVARKLGARAPQTTAAYVRSFVLGLALWSGCAWGLSALDWGSQHDLRALSLLFALAVALARPQAACVYAYRRACALPASARAVVVLIGAWLLVLFAKTSVAVNFDSLWYGLRGEFVLVGAGSAFKSSGLVSAVYYFPKLFELLLVPVSGVGSSSVIAGMSIGVLAIFAFACHALLVQLDVRSATLRVAIVLLCLTVPVVANTSIDPKPDMLAATLLLATWIHASRFLARRKRDAALWAIACALLAIQSKLVALPYVFALAAVVAVVLATRRREAIPSDATAPTDHSGLVAAILAAAVTLLITLRTFVLTGMPTIGPDALFHLWKALGFELKSPVGTLQWTRAQDWADVPALAFDVLFRPQYAEHIVNYWTGNVWLWALAAIPLFAPRRVEHASGAWWRPPGLALACCGLALMFSIGYYVRGGDGNYYLVAVVAAVLLGVSALARRMSEANGHVLFACIAAFTLFGAAYSFVSADWATGTHAFDHDFHRGFATHRRLNRQLMRNYGVAEIDAYLHHAGRNARVVGCLPDDLDLRIRARTESIDQISYSRPDFLATSQAFLGFLRDDSIRFLIVPRDMHAPTYCLTLPSVHAAIATLAADASVQRIDDRDYVMYDLTGWLARPAAQP